MIKNIFKNSQSCSLILTQRWCSGMIYESLLSSHPVFPKKHQRRNGLKTKRVYLFRLTIFILAHQPVHTLPSHQLFIPLSCSNNGRQRSYIYRMITIISKRKVPHISEGYLRQLSLPPPVLLSAHNHASVSIKSHHDRGK